MARKKTKTSMDVGNIEYLPPPPPSMDVGNIEYLPPPPPSMGVGDIEYLPTAPEMPDYWNAPPGAPIRQVRDFGPPNYWGAPLDAPIRQITDYESQKLQEELGLRQTPEMEQFEQALKKNKLERRLNPFAGTDPSGVDTAAKAATSQASAITAMQAAMEGQQQPVSQRLRPFAARQRPAQIGDYGLSTLAAQSKGLMEGGRERRKQTIQDLSAAQEQQELALEAQEEAQAQRYQKIGQARQQAVEAFDTAQQQLADVQTRRATAQRNFETKLQDANLSAQYALLPIDEVKRHQAILADETIDPKEKAKSRLALDNASRATDKRSVGTRIMGAIAMAIGAAASARTGGPNFAMQLIERSIDRDIQSQRDLFTRAKGQVKGLKNDYARYMGIYGDERLAVLEAQRQKLMQVDAKIDEITAMSQAPEMAARRELIKGQLAQQIALKTEQIQRLGESTEMQSIQQQAGIAGQRMQVGLANQRARMQAQTQQAAAQAQGRGTTDISGLEKTGQVTQKQSDAVRKSVGAKRKFDALIDDMVQLQDQYTISERLKDKVGQSKIGAQLKTKAGTAFNLLRQATGSGAALTPEEIELIDPDGVLRDPKKILGAKIQLQAVKQAANAGYHNWLDTNNYKVRGTTGTTGTPIGFRP